MPAKKAIPRVFLVLTLCAGFVSCVGSIRRDAEPDDPLASPSPTLEDGLGRFFELNMGEEIQGLALSGGGQNGAYGVGFVRGWREIGIPRFHAVTGVSTGALIASHVFLDSPEADDVVSRFFTSVERSDILTVRMPLVGLTSDAVADMTPLERLLDDVVSDDVIDAVAAASEGGKRLLLVGTVNLDTGGYRIWDMGAMARARQYVKYRAVLRASAGPPVAVPPVYLEGNMHCDGSTASSVFIPFGDDILPEERRARLRSLAAARGVPLITPGTLYVIVNGLQEPATTRVDPTVLDIAARAMDVMTYSIRLGNLWYLYDRVGTKNGEFRLRFLPDSLRKEAAEFMAFDPKRMRVIFEQGVRDGRDPGIWRKEPPFLRPDLPRRTPQTGCQSSDG